jgi:hypothetical protein
MLDSLSDHAFRYTGKNNGSATSHAFDCIFASWRRCSLYSKCMCAMLCFTRSGLMLVMNLMGIVVWREITQHYACIALVHASCAFRVCFSVLVERISILLTIEIEVFKRCSLWISEYVINLFHCARFITCRVVLATLEMSSVPLSRLILFGIRMHVVVPLRGRVRVCASCAAFFLFLLLTQS